MNVKLQAIFARRSVRRFLDCPVEESHERDLLEAAMAAPSACGKDPWRFFVVRSKPSLKEIAAALPNGGFLAEAPLGLMVCGDLEHAHAGELSYLLQDCSAAIENILLAAAMLGLGACWLGVHPREDRVDFMRRFFQLPDSVVPVGAIAIGWPVETPAPRTRFNPDFVHRHH